jgi:glutamine synthetase
MKPDLATLRRVPWQEGTAMLLADLQWEDGSDVVASPRQILQAQLDRLARAGMGPSSAPSSSSSSSTTPTRRRGPRATAT